MAQLLGVLEQGLIYAILALGVYITFKILDFPDMTVDSSFPLGAAVTALMISGGIHPLWTLPAALAGMAKPSSAASSILVSSRQQTARRRAGKLSLLLYMAGALRFPVRRQRHRT